MPCPFGLWRPNTLRMSRRSEHSGSPYGAATSSFRCRVPKKEPLNSSGFSKQDNHSDFARSIISLGLLIFTVHYLVSIYFLKALGWQSLRLPVMCQGMWSES